MEIKECGINILHFSVVSASKERLLPNDAGFLLFFLRTGGKLHFYSLGTTVRRKLQVSRGMQSLWLWVSNGGEQHPVGTRFCAAKSSVLYLLRPLTRERGCHCTGQAVSCCSRRTNICKHGRLADIRSSGVGGAAKSAGRRPKLCCIAGGAKGI